MPEEIPVSEVRRVVIQYEIQVPRGGAAPAASAAPQTQGVDRDMVEAVKRELIKSGFRNPDIFGGRA